MSVQNLQSAVRLQKEDDVVVFVEYGVKFPDVERHFDAVEIIDFFIARNIEAEV